jgi:hypothetical protein
MPMPAHFQSAADILTEEMVGDTLECGSDSENQVKAITTYLGAGTTDPGWAT